MFEIYYGSDATRSAGDAIYKTLAGALSAYRSMVRQHPAASMALYRRDAAGLHTIRRRSDDNLAVDGE
jgi:hypothetical protein